MMINEAVTKEQIEAAFDGVEPVFSIYGRQAADAIGVVTLAFSDNPLARWMYPSPSEYLRHFPEFVRAFAGRSFEKGSAYLAPEAAGAALWLRPEIKPDDDLLIGLFWSSISNRIQHDLFPMFEQMSAHRPKEPHWYLPMIGVDTRLQRRGIGTALMQHALDNCDLDGMPAYLESSNPRNISLYERFGFEVIGIIQVGEAPPVYPMLRQPQQIWDEDLFVTMT